LKSYIEEILIRRKVKYWFLESAVGFISLCTGAIPSDRAFVRRLYGLLSSVKVKKPFYLIRFTQEVNSDALVWLNCLNDFNGECYIPEKKLWLTNEAMKLLTDSAVNLNLGCGAYFAGHLIQFKWPESWAGDEIMRDISLLELVPIILALFIWESHFTHKTILFRVDNMSLVTIINKRTSKSKSVMKLLHPLVLCTLHNNMQFKAVHIEGSINMIADAFSRFQMSRFREVASNAEQHPAETST
jgi:hypothetical protein